MDRYLEGWKNASEVYIPTINMNYKQENVVIREKIPAIENEVDPMTETILLSSLEQDHDESETVILSPPKLVVYFVRLRTKEKIMIDLESGIIGKASDVEYRVQGNNAISRRHARISVEDEKVYFEDLRSSNHSWVNQKMATGIVQLKNEDVIKLADEEFQVYIGHADE